MRDIFLITIVFVILPFVLSRPHVGIYLWTWLGFMNPHRMTWGIAYDFPFAQLVAVVTLISVLVSRRPKRVPWTRETVLLLVFILWMLFTTIFAFHPDLAWEEWDRVWKIMLMVYVTMLVITTRQELDWLVWVIVLSLGFFGIKGGLFTIAKGGIYHVWGPAGSFIGGNNEMAMALIMAIPLMHYLQLQAKNILVKHGMTVAMIICGISIIGSQSRGALLGILVMGGFLWLKSRKLFFTTMAILVVGGAVLAVMPQEWYDHMETIKTYRDDASAMSRINAWWMAYNLAKDSITGGGFHAFHEYAFTLYAPKPNNVADAHSIYFEVMGEHGFIGFFLFILLAWFTWNTGNRIIRETKHNNETKWAADLARMLQVSMIGYATAGAFLGLAYFDFYYTLIAIMVICQVIMQKQGADLQPVKEQKAQHTAG